MDAYQPQTTSYLGNEVYIIIIGYVIEYSEAVWSKLGEPVLL